MTVAHVYAHIWPMPGTVTHIITTNMLLLPYNDGAIQSYMLYYIINRCKYLRISVCLRYIAYVTGNIVLIFANIIQNNV